MPVGRASGFRTGSPPVSGGIYPPFSALMILGISMMQALRSFLYLIAVFKSAVTSAEVFPAPSTLSSAVSGLVPFNITSDRRASRTVQFPCAAERSCGSG